MGSSVSELQAAIKKHYGQDVKPMHRDIEHRYYYISMDYGSNWTFEFPFGETVVINWNFDEDHKLDRITVEQVIDGP